MEITKILWPTDLSQASTSALEQVVYLSLKLGAEIHLLYVADDVRLADHYYGDADPKMLQSLQDKERQTAEHTMTRICEERLAGCPLFERHIAKGRPAAEIVAKAQELGAGLIVMASRGLGLEGQDQGLFGSVTQKVLQTSPVPVLVVRPPA